MPVGVIGSGSFGIAITLLLQENTDVLMFTRNAETAQKINTTHVHNGIELAENVRATSNAQEICEKCHLIMPMVPSGFFRETIRMFAPYLKPHHLIIHGTKGLDLVGITDEELSKARQCTRANVRTMSEVIAEETSVIRIGCLSGPNLAKELIEKQPGATLIASRFDEVIDAGQKVLGSKRFHVFGSYEILGVELAGALKNIIALGSGILGGKKLGRNLQAMLISRGLTEMISLGSKLGAGNKAFLGTAGIGDLVATATSTDSRNYKFGMRLAKGEKLDEIIASEKEIAEGVRTLRITYKLAKSYRLHLPIIQRMYLMVFENHDIDKAIEYLMEYPYDVDVDFV